jgi:hypothetical protein
VAHQHRLFFAERMHQGHQIARVVQHRALLRPGGLAGAAVPAHVGCGHEETRVRQRL